MSKMKGGLSYGVKGKVNGMGKFDIQGIYKEIGGGKYDGGSGQYKC